MPTQNNRYSSAEVSRMRQDAIRRAQEMQRRAGGNRRTGQSNSYPQQNFSKSHSPQRQEDTSRQNRSFNPSVPEEKKDSFLPGQQKENILDELIGKFKIDKDRALILLVLFVLLREKADSKLLLALCYLLI